MPTNAFKKSTPPMKERRMQNVPAWTSAFAALLLLATGPVQAQVLISSNGFSTPDPSAMLHVDVSTLATKKGLLVPRMTSAQRTAVIAPANGLIVYQTNNAPPSNPEGYWYYDATLPGWVPIMANGGGWNIVGNAGTNPTTNYIGTSDNQSFSIRTNAVDRMRVTNARRVGIGTATPNEVLEVNGGLSITGNAATNLQGDIRFNAASNSHDGNIDGTVNGWYQLENVFGERTGQNYQIITNTCVPSYRIIGTAGGAGGTSTTGTIETPYGQLWEDNRTQFLYTAADMLAAQICPGDITELAFWVKTGSPNTYAMNNCQIKMKNTTGTGLPVFENTGLQTVWNGNIPTGGLIGNNWNNYVFNSPFTWNGSSNVVVEFCYDNPDWSGGSTPIGADNATYQGIHGLYCDACGQATYALCQSLGSPGGCNITDGDNLITCDGTLPLWNGAIGTANKRACIRFRAPFGTITTVIGTGDYLYSTTAVMIGSAAWATSGGPLPTPYAFKGPGTISAQSAVWGGNTLLSDHVFDIYFDGKPRPGDEERAKGYAPTPLNEMVNYVERERHLPTIEGRDAWKEKGMFSVDELNTQLWVTVEEQALYIKELNERAKMLEQFLLQRRLNAVAPSVTK